MNILIALQNFASATGDAFTSFFEKATFFGELNTTLILMAVIYWCIDKALGVYLLMGWNWCRQLNGFLKVTVCEYRPWIQNPDFKPNEKALKTATGYSFPSGHTMNSTAFFGGLAVRKNTQISLRILCIIVFILVGLSRMYLGVHFPQDVLVGAVIALATMFLCNLCVEKTENSRYGDFIVAGISLTTAILIAVYAAVKSYPIDYDSEGKILVEGAKMAKDTFTGVGWNLGFFTGWIIERRFVKFANEATLAQKGVRLVLGVLGFYIISLVLIPLIIKPMGGFSGCLIKGFLQMIYIVLLFPLCIKAIEKKSNQNK